VIGLVSVVGGFLVGLWNPLLNNSTTTEGARVDVLFALMLGIGTTIFLIVNGALLYSVIRFRSRSDDDEGVASHGHMGLEILWTAIPAAIVTGLSLYSYIVLAVNEQEDPYALNVELTARQFGWEFYYPQEDVRSSDLHLPRGQQVLLKMRSADVVHAFWVPEFRMKKDLMPDRITEVRFTPDRNGTYPIVCSRICGVGHAFMRSNVVVEDASAFNNWLAQQSAGQAALASGDPLAAGRALYQRYGCNACHVLGDANATGQVGPGLDGIGTRAAGIVPGQSAEDYLREAIVDPNVHIVGGYQPNVMPQDYDARMSDQELEAMVQYLLLQK
jgi:cytochrome c oxidase subunit 2